MRHRKQGKRPFYILLIALGILTIYWKSERQASVPLNAQETIENKLSVPKQNIERDTSLTLYICPRTFVGSPEVLLKREGYIVSYNPEKKIANWVGWKLTPQRLEERTKRSNEFLPDPDLPLEEAITTKDYKGSGWDRGHLCPAGDNKWSWKAMRESFYMTNICPQHHYLNRGDWNELEQKCRKWVKKDSSLYIVAGPIFYDRMPRTFSKKKIAIPDAFFKVILSFHPHPKAIGFIYKNNEGDHPLDSYVNSIDEVERITGMDFFTELPDDIEEQIEKEYNLKEWR